MDFYQINGIIYKDIFGEAIIIMRNKIQHSKRFSATDERSRHEV